MEDGCRRSPLPLTDIPRLPPSASFPRKNPPEPPLESITSRTRLGHAPAAATVATAPPPLVVPKPRWPFTRFFHRQPIENTTPAPNRRKLPYYTVPVSSLGPIFVSANDAQLPAIQREQGEPRAKCFLRGSLPNRILRQDIAGIEKLAPAHAALVPSGVPAASPNPTPTAPPTAPSPAASPRPLSRSGPFPEVPFLRSPDIPNER